MTRVVVVGAGIIGLSIAWRLADAGDDVVVVDPAPGRGASWVAAGMLAPASEAHPDEVDLLTTMRRSAALWPDFAAELARAAGRDVPLLDSGTVLAGVDEDDGRALDDTADRLAALGLDLEPLRARQLRARVPALSPRVRPGFAVSGDHAVDNRMVVDALLGAVRRLDVDMVTAAATSVEGEGSADGVRLDDGRVLPGDVVVVAAGAWSTTLSLPAAALGLPVRPVRGEIVRLQDDASHRLLDHVVRGHAHGRSVYLVPRRTGEVVVGATSDERGFDVTVTAGGVLDLLRAATDLVPGVRELAVLETSAGLRPGTPDNTPLVGPTPVDGLVLATGHHRHGVLLAPLTAEVVARWVRQRRRDDVDAVLDPRRFVA